LQRTLHRTDVLLGRIDAVLQRVSAMLQDLSKSKGVVRFRVLRVPPEAPELRDSVAPGARFAYA
jgi:hypothetical protein